MAQDNDGWLQRIYENGGRLQKVYFCHWESLLRSTLKVLKMCDISVGNPYFGPFDESLYPSNKFITEDFR